MYLPRDGRPETTTGMGWMVQYQDENGHWLDYQWTTDHKEERSMVRHLNRNGNRTRTIVAVQPTE